MDQVKFSSIEFIKWVVLVLMLEAVTNSAAAEISSIPPPAMSPPRRVGPKIKASIVIVPVCFLSAFMLICFFFFYFRRCAERQLTLASTIGNRSERRSMKLAAARGLDPAVIATFTSVTYSTLKEIKVGHHVVECAVCLIEFRDHEAIRLLPECNHVFHRGCIDEWLSLHITCPICRETLAPNSNRLCHDTESWCGPNGPRKGHVSTDVFDLKHDLSPVRTLYRSNSAGNSMLEQCIENVQIYPIRLPEEGQDVKNLVTNPSTSHIVSNITETNLKRSLKSMSANFLRRSDYFDYERFRKDKRSGEHNLAITRSFNSHNGSIYVEDEPLTNSQRFTMLVMSPLNKV